MKTLLIAQLVLLLAGCKQYTKPVSVQTQKSFTYDYRNETGTSYLLQKDIHCYTDLNTVFIKVATSKGIGC